jgi:hypothetical protein
MKHSVFSSIALLLSLSVTSPSYTAEQRQPDAPLPIPNRLIDYNGFLANAQKVHALREKHRVTEKQFLEMAAEPGTIVFDARSDSKYKMAHYKGAVHLSLPDTTAAELAKVIPNKQTRILIYCNNNFLHEQTAFASKGAPASLNIYTFNTLYTYGYTNVYELGPLIDFRKTILPFEGTLVHKP